MGSENTDRTPFSSNVSCLNDQTLAKQMASKEEEKVLSSVGVPKWESTTWLGKWDARDAFYVSFVTFVHVLCLFAPSTFSWNAFSVAALLYVLTILGITLSYHRNLSHRSFKLPKYLEYMFAYFGFHAYQGDPIFWVSTHRNHHKYTETELDPHSPIQGFWFAHIFWIFNRNKMIQKGANLKNVADLTRQRYYRFLEKTMVLHVYMMGALLYMLGGIPFIVWGMGVRTVCSYHATFIVNSIGHTWGHQAWNTKDMSRNVWYLTLFTLGEGWHNNHHAFEFSARQGLEWWQLDITWYVIKVLEYLGFATDVKVPSEKHKQKRAFKKGIEAAETPTT